MKTMQEMQSLMQSLREVYTDVRLLDSAALSKIQEGAPTSAITEDLCYACRHKDRLSAHCAARMAFETRREQCRLEYFEPNIAQITARYYEVDGEPYVLELVKILQGDSIIDVEDSEHLLSEVSGYSTKLYHDALTGVFNRRYYEEVVRSMVGPAGIAVMDLDDFKIYNDTYGHHAGDLTLEAASRAIRSCLRTTDTIVRFGGDEFLLIMPSIPADYFRTKLEQIREKVRTCVVPGYSHLHPSISIGGAMQSLVDPMDIVIRRADRLMYQAKDQKNAVALADGTSAFLALDDPLNRRQQILIVDDSEMNRLLLTDILSRDYRILEAATGEDCVQLLQQHAGDIALVLLDLIMPGMNGFDVLDYMNRNHLLEDVPVIMISSENSDDSIRKAYEKGASDYVNRPFDAKVVYQRVYNTLKLYAKQRRLVTLVSDQIRKQERNTSMLVGVLSQIVEFRNGESGAHVQHIRVLTQKILERLLEKTTRYAIPAEDQDNIPLASSLHDIGKIAIDEKVLNKPGRLTPEEFEQVKKHTTYGADMLHKLNNFNEEPLLQTAYQIARWHHERWDGRGYPDGLKGDEIPIAAQIVSLADVYDALTSERCYKKAFSHEKAIQMILHGECGTFNPLLLECLLDIQGELQDDLRNASYW